MKKLQPGELVVFKGVVVQVIGYCPNDAWVEVQELVTPSRYPVIESRLKPLSTGSILPDIDSNAEAKMASKAPKYPPPYLPGDVVYVLMEEGEAERILEIPHHPWISNGGMPPYESFTVKPDSYIWGDDCWYYRGPDGAGWHDCHLKGADGEHADDRFSQLLKMK